MKVKREKNHTSNRGRVLVLYIWASESGNPRFCTQSGSDAVACFFFLFSHVNTLKSFVSLIQAYDIKNRYKFPGDSSGGASGVEMAWLPDWPRVCVCVRGGVIEEG